jgi:hypothetical protein
MLQHGRWDSRCAEAAASMLLPDGIDALQFIGDGEKIQELEDFGELTALLQGAPQGQP